MALMMGLTFGDARVFKLCMAAVCDTQLFFIKIPKYLDIATDALGFKDEAATSTLKITTNVPSDCHYDSYSTPYCIGSSVHYVLVFLVSGLLPSMTQCI